jgi:toxin ParE1/3/4
MTAYVLTPAALADLEGIASYIALDDPVLGDRVVAGLEEAVRRLAEFPGMGHARPDLDAEELRVWVSLSYLMVYRPRMRPLQILRIIHGARDLRSELAGPAPPRPGRRGRT